MPHPQHENSVSCIKECVCYLFIYASVLKVSHRNRDYYRASKSFINVHLQIFEC